MTASCALAISYDELLVCRETVLGELLSSLDRPALHAKTLGFKHPVSGQALSFDSDLPADFSLVLEGLRSLPLF